MNVDDILSSILTYLPLYDRLSINLVSKRWKRINSRVLIRNVKILGPSFPFTNIRRVSIAPVYISIGVLHDKKIEELTIRYSHRNISYNTLVYITHLTSLRHLSFNSEEPEVLGIQNILTGLTSLEIYRGKPVALPRITGLLNLNMHGYPPIHMMASLQSIITNLVSLDMFFAMDALGDCIPQLTKLTRLEINGVNPYRLTSLHLLSLTSAFPMNGDFSVLTTLQDLTLEYNGPISIPPSLTYFMHDGYNNLQITTLQNLKALICYDLPTCNSPSTLTCLNIEGEKYTHVTRFTNIRELHIQNVYAVEPLLYLPYLTKLGIQYLNIYRDECSMTMLTNLKQLYIRLDRPSYHHDILISDIEVMTNLRHIHVYDKKFTREFPTTELAVRYLRKFVIENAEK